MGDFFSSPIVRASIEERDYLRDLMMEQWEVVSATQSDDSMIELLHRIWAALTKEEVLYARLNLSDDPEAREFLETIKTSCKFMGHPDPAEFYKKVKSDVVRHLEEMGQDLSDLDDLP